MRYGGPPSYSRVLAEDFSVLRRRPYRQLRLARGRRWVLH